MKRFLVLLLLSCTVSPAFADCAARGLWVWPAAKKINRNPVIMLEGYASSQKIITGLNTKHAVYLRSGDEVVKLQVTETHVGGFYLTQALLKPASLLTAGKTYRLCVDSLGKYNEVRIWNAEEKKYMEPEWLVTEENDQQVPVWDEKPRETRKTLIHYGCGPEISVSFSFTAADASALLVRTTVRNLKTNRETIYYVKTEKNTVRVGHGMCSGEFSFEEKDNTTYSVTFQLMDASGNKGDITAPLTFTPPTEESPR